MRFIKPFFVIVVVIIMPFQNSPCLLEYDPFTRVLYSVYTKKATCIKTSFKKDLLNNVVKQPKYFSYEKKILNMIHKV